MKYLNNKANQPHVFVASTEAYYDSLWVGQSDHAKERLVESADLLFGDEVAEELKRSLSNENSNS